MAKQRARWIEDLSSIYRADREQGILAQWIKEAVEILSRRNPEISMDQEAFEKLSIRQIAKKFSLMDRGSVEISIEKRKEGLDRKEFVDDLSRSCRA